MTKRIAVVMALILAISGCANGEEFSAEQISEAQAGLLAACETVLPEESPKPTFRTEQQIELLREAVAQNEDVRDREGLRVATFLEENEELIEECLAAPDESRPVTVDALAECLEEAGGDIEVVERSKGAEHVLAWGPDGWIVGVGLAPNPGVARSIARQFEGTRQADMETFIGENPRLIGLLQTGSSERDRSLAEECSAIAE